MPTAPNGTGENGSSEAQRYRHQQRPAESDRGKEFFESMTPRLSSSSVRDVPLNGPEEFHAARPQTPEALQYLGF